MTRWLDPKVKAERDKKVIELYQAGFTMRQIAPQFRLGVGSVDGIIRDHNIPRRGNVREPGCLEAVRQRKRRHDQVRVA